jgi:hypothetical protein
LGRSSEHHSFGVHTFWPNHAKNAVLVCAATSGHQGVDVHTFWPNHAKSTRLARIEKSGVWRALFWADLPKITVSVCTRFGEIAPKTQFWRAQANQRFWPNQAKSRSFWVHSQILYLVCMFSAKSAQNAQ